MKLRRLSFEGDSVLDKKEKEKSNYYLVSLNATTFGIAQFILTELMPIDLNGCGRLTICANAEQEMMGWPGYNPVPEMGVSWYNLDRETSRRLYDLNRFSKAFSEELSNDFEQFVAGIVMDVLVEIDRMHGDKI